MGLTALLFSYYQRHTFNAPLMLEANHVWIQLFLGEVFISNFIHINMLFLLKEIDRIYEQYSLSVSDTLKFVRM